jgi:hypothetical protein
MFPEGECDVSDTSFFTDCAAADKEHDRYRCGPLFVHFWRSDLSANGGLTNSMAGLDGVVVANPATLLANEVPQPPGCVVEVPR